MNNAKELDQIWASVNEWERTEKQKQELRISKLRQGFLFLCLNRDFSEVRKVSIADTVLATNVAYGSNVDSPTVEHFAIAAYEAGFLTPDDEPGKPLFRTKLQLGIFNAVNAGLIDASTEYATYTHKLYDPTLNNNFMNLIER